MPFVLSLAAVALTTAILYKCQQIVVAHEHLAYARPYGILFVVPIAMLTALGGVRVGLFTLAFSLFSLEFILFAPHFSWRVSHPRDWLELVLLLGVGSLVIYSMDAVRKNGTLSARVSDAEARMRVSEERRREFSREVLLAVTGGRLLLVDADELSRMVHGAPVLTQPLIHSEDATGFRRALRLLLSEQGLTEIVRTDDALTVAMEAATNAVKHGLDGVARVWLNQNEVTILVSDHGTGIQPQDLARATLEGGYSTEGTLGMGYHLMLQMVDLLALSTSEEGTQVLMRVGGQSLATPEERFLDRFSLAA